MLRTTPALTFTALAISVASFTTLQSLLVPVLSVIQDDLGTTTAGVTWTLTAWLITAAVATPLLGRVGDMVGKRRVFLIALGAIAVGSVLAALAPTLGVLIVARVIQGFGGAIFPLTFGIVRDAFPSRRLPAAIGALSAIIATGSGLGTVLSGPLAEAFTWHALFLLPLGLTLIGGVMTILFVPESAVRTGGRINIPAALLLSGWLVALLLPLSTASQWGWDSPLVIGLLALAVVLLAAWIAVELRSRVPLVDMRMMRLPGVWTTNLAAVLIGAAMFGTWAFVPRLLQAPSAGGFGFDATVSEVGLLMLPMLVLMATAGFLAGPFSRIAGFRVQLSVASALIAIAAISIGVLHQSAWEIAVAGGVFGFGLGVAFAAMTSLIVQSVPASQTGVASGMNSNLRTIGSAIGTALMTAIIAGSVTSTSAGLPTESGYAVGFVTIGILAAIAAGVALIGSRRPLRVATESVTIPVVEEPQPVAA